jgi:1-acyl-sn-glycerol-3-phosphate acyltransferase
VPAVEVSPVVNPVEVPVPVAAPPRRVSLPVIGASAPRAPEPAEEEVRDLVSLASSEIDAFGRDPVFEQRAEKALAFFYRRYFRVEVRNIENVPDKGAVLLVANHSGSLPLDGAMLKLALSLDHPAHRRLRPLAENFVYHFPFVGVLLNRFGAVRACQENAEALLRDGEAVAVFPEGVKGLGKPFRKRYQLQRFGRGGFIRLALRTKTPIVPVAIVGAEETTPVIARLVRPGRTLGLPYLPVTPTFPFLGPLGLVPLPTKWTIEFGEPLRFTEDEAADDLTIARLTEDIRGDIQARLDKLLSQRTGWFG